MRRSRGGLQRWRAVTIFAIHLGLYLTSTIVCGQVAGTSEPADSGAHSQVDGEAKSPDLGEVTRLIMEGTNRFRKQEGRGELKSQQQLVATARDFADFLARTDKFSHEADGSQPTERAKKHDYDYCIVAENIAYEYSSAGFATEDLARGSSRAGRSRRGTARTCLIRTSSRRGWRSHRAKNPASITPCRSSAGPGRRRSSSPS